VEAGQASQDVVFVEAEGDEVGVVVVVCYGVAEGAVGEEVEAWEGGFGDGFWFGVAAGHASRWVRIWREVFLPSLCEKMRMVDGVVVDI
jgi:hypothetical protein